MSTESTGSNNMSKKRSFIDILFGRVDTIDGFAIYVDIRQIFRQVLSIGRLNRHIRDPVSNTQPESNFGVCVSRL